MLPMVLGLASATFISLAAGSFARAADEKLVAALPDAVRDVGKLNVTISLAYPPMEYSDAGSTELKGFDIDLAKAIAERLGLTAEFQNVEFPQLIPQVVTGRSDLIMTAFSDKVERQTQLDFIDYFKTGNVFYSTADHQGDLGPSVRGEGTGIGLGRRPAVRCDDRQRAVGALAMQAR